MSRTALALAMTFLLGPAAASASSEFAGIADLGPALAQIRGRIRGLKAAAPGARFPAAALPPLPNGTRPTVFGIDVSRYQDRIEWDRVRGQGVSFAYIKATESGDLVDPEFARNWQGAGRAGLARGAYHFYKFCVSAADQADNFLKAVPPDADALPMAIDLELSGGCRPLPSKAAFAADLAVFVGKVRAAYGKTPILYVSYEIYDKYFKGEAVAHKIWITDIRAAPQAPTIPGWTFWQYSDRGRIKGIGWRADLNVFNGTLSEFAALAGPGPAAAFKPTSPAK